MIKLFYYFLLGSSIFETYQLNGFIFILNVFFPSRPREHFRQTKINDRGVGHTTEISVMILGHTDQNFDQSKTGEGNLLRNYTGDRS